MAVAVQAAEAVRMGPSEEGGVHPFFNLYKDKAKSLMATTTIAGPPLTSILNPSGNPVACRDPSMLSRPSEPEQADTDAVKPLAEELRTNQGTGDHEDATEGPKGRRVPRPTKKPGVEGKKQTKVNGQTNLMVKTFCSGSDTRVHQDPDEAPVCENDFNDSRRKRRRTNSMDQASLVGHSTILGTWEEQLKAAADGSEDSMPASPPLGDLAKIEAPRTSLPLEPDTSSLLLEGVERPAEDLQTMGRAVDVVSKPAEPPKAVTPKKKILKLGKNGKLGSPKPHTGAGVQKNKVGRPKKNVARTSPVRMVIIRYGKDTASRTTTGHRIESIRAGPLSVSNDPPRKPECPSGISIPRGPTKPTHPFFNGKLGPPINVKPGNTATKRRTSIDLQSMRSGTTSPQKKSGVIAPDAARAWAALGGLGHRTMSTDCAKITRFPGAMEPLWPPRDMQHCRGLGFKGDVALSALGSRQTTPSNKKLKSSETQVHPSEDVFYPLRQYHQASELESKGQDRRECMMKVLRRPERRLMTGTELQEALRPRLASKLPLSTNARASDSSPPPSSSQNAMPTHSALLHVFKGISTSFSAFDKFQCEARDWVQKYSPSCAAHVLQQGREAVVLRDWLKSLTVMSVNGGNAPKLKVPTTPPKKRKKKRKRAEELDGFIISSEDEANEMDELTDPESTAPGDNNFFGPKRSVISNRRNSNPSNSSLKTSNAAVISGPHGCGKTAAVYAVAQELGFEIFEINAGTRRSGRDLLDRVGDVAHNHLVHQGVETGDLSDGDGHFAAALQADIDSGRQKTVQSFLKPKAKGKPASKIREEAKTTATKPKNPEKKPKHQKQSVILLEEVDILFEEDRQFWTTVLGLISQSKRPIIMTCTDESRLPLGDMHLHAIFRLAPPPEELAVDYLMLIAGNEGHLLSRDAVSKLYSSKNYDLRASITELNFWCQMAVGDMKGGLEWMLIRSNAEECLNDQGQPLRVVSDGTYCADMGFFCRDQAYDGLVNDISDEMQRMSEEMQDWDYEKDLCALLDPEVVSATSKDMPPQRLLDMLVTYDLSFDTLSVADVLPSFTLRRGNDVRQGLLYSSFITNMHRSSSTSPVHG